MAENLKTLNPGEYLFLQGHVGHEVYFLKSGALEVVLAPANADLTAEYVTQHGQVLDTFDQPGQLLGEMSPILDCPRTASIRAVKESTVLAADMRPGALENALRVKPALGIKIAEELARRINKTNERLKKLDMRVLRFLEEVRVALNTFGQSYGAEIDSTRPEFSGNVFIEISKLAGTLNALPVDLPVSLSLPYDQAGAFFAYFGGSSFQSSGTQSQAVGVADALSKVQGKRYVSGQVLCTSGEEAKELFILLQGRLNVVVGRRTIQTVEGRGSIVGEMAFLLKTRRTASVISVEPSMVLAVPFDKMEPLFTRVPQLLILMLKQLAGRLLQVDTLFQKSTWRSIFFRELLPAFAQTLKSSMESLPETLAGPARDSAQKTMALTEEAIGAMSKSDSQDSGQAPFSLAELAGGTKLPPPAAEQSITETPPGEDSHQEHIDFVLSLADGRRGFGPPHTPKSQFAEYMSVDEKSLVVGRVIGKIGRSGTYAEIILDDAGTDDSRKQLAQQISKAVSVPHLLFAKPPDRWLYYYETGSSGAISADAIPHAAQFIDILCKADRESMTPLERSRARRLYLEAVTSILEAHWSSPGKFTELTPSEKALVQFGAPGDAPIDRLKLDALPGRTLVPMVDFAKRVVIQLAGGDSAVMGGVESAKQSLPEKEKQIADLIESRKKTYADLQVPYEDAREGPLLQQIEKMAQTQRLKEKGGASGEALRDIASTGKEAEKLLDERNAFVNQKLKGDPGRKAIGQIKVTEDQIRTAIREKLDLLDIINTPPAEADAKKEKESSVLLPINLLNGFRDLMSDIHARLRQTLQPESLEVTPVFSDGVRLYASRDMGIAIQNIFSKDKSLPSGQDFPPILRVPGEGYAIYAEEWNVLIVPLYQAVDPFQLMAHGIGEWRWSRVPEAERKKFQKAVKGGSSIKMDQLGIYFARDYRMLLDEKDVDEGSAKFIQGVMISTPPPAAAAAGAKAK